ncbi:MAG: thiamine-phosphate kinase [Planctomycetota bacterium]|jgi:thiamine-monophosphate kinase
MKEFELVEWICRQGADLPAEWVGPGDDCAVVTVGDGRVLVTTDQVLDGVHLHVTKTGPKAAGRKALARNLSDIAAMAGEATCAVASVAMPKDFDQSAAEEIYHGLREIGDAFGCPVIGGDVAMWDKPLAVSVTVLGDPAGIEPVLRSGAVAGDALCVTGALGGAWKAGRDLTFTPRIAEARLLAQRFDLRAMIDLSDGLAADLPRLCRASGVGAELMSDCIPVHADAADLMAALCDGEDYELLFALPADQADSLLADPPFETAVTKIGAVTAGTDIMLIAPDGQRRPMPAGGWEHTG